MKSGLLKRVTLSLAALGLVAATAGVIDKEAQAQGTLVYGMPADHDIHAGAFWNISAD